MIGDSKLHKALQFAEEAHRGQARRNGEPYFWHPIRVWRLLKQVGAPLDVQVAGILHDVIEDCPAITPEMVWAEFGQEVLDLVMECTKDASGAFSRLNSTEAHLIKLCDAFDNCTDTENMRGPMDTEGEDDVIRAMAYNQKKRKFFGIDGSQVHTRSTRPVR